MLKNDQKNTVRDINSAPVIKETGAYKIIHFYAFFLFVMSFITKRVAIVITIPRGKHIQTFFTRPATINITKDIAATVIA